MGAVRFQLSMYSSGIHRTRLVDYVSTVASVTRDDWVTVCKLMNDMSESANADQLHTMRAIIQGGI
eukprot:2038866-Amphidinium_carterae.1